MQMNEFTNEALDCDLKDVIRPVHDPAWSENVTAERIWAHRFFVMLTNVALDTLEGYFLI